MTIHNFCTGPNTSCHEIPSDGSPCDLCIKTVEEYETQSGRIFDPNGPNLTICDACGELIQYFESHSQACTPFDICVLCKKTIGPNQFYESVRDGRAHKRCLRLGVREVKI